MLRMAFPLVAFCRFAESPLAGSQEVLAVPQRCQGLPLVQSALSQRTERAALDRRTGLPRLGNGSPRSFEIAGRKSALPK
jgi:hypothetical protein